MPGFLIGHMFSNRGVRGRVSVESKSDLPFHPRMLYNMSVQFWVALQSLPQGMSATLPPLQGDKWTDTGTPHENDTRPLDTLFCDRAASSR